MRPAIASCILGFLVVASSSAASAQATQSMGGHDKHKFQLISTTFSEGDTLPLGAVWDQCAQYPGVTTALQTANCSRLVNSPSQTSNIVRRMLHPIEECVALIEQ